MVFSRKYNIATATDTHIHIPMIEAGSNDQATGTTWTPSAGDVLISKDNGTQTNLGTLPTYTNGSWRFIFTATELQAKTINVSVVDAATKAIEDQFFIIETFGNANAMYHYDPQDSVRLGLTALPDADANAAGGMTISTSGNLDLDTIFGRITDDVATSSSLSAVNNATNTLLTRLSSIRANYLDNLSGHVPQSVDGLSLIGLSGSNLSSMPWNPSWDSDVESEVIDGLISLGLDHLVSSSVSGTDITDNSIFAKIVSKSATADWDSFNNITDSLEGNADRLVDLNADQSGVTVGTVNNIVGLVAGSGGISVAAESFTVITGTEISSTYIDTRAEDGTYHIFDPAGGTTDGYYQFDITNSGIPQSVTFVYYAQSNGDTYTYFAYNWATTTFEQVKTVAASNETTNLTLSAELLVDHVGTGANAGKVRLQVYSTTGTRHAVDRTYCTYTVATSGIPNGSTITLVADATNQNFIGHSWSFDLAGYAVSGSYISGAKSIIGTGTIANNNPLVINDAVIGDCNLSAYFIIADSFLPNTLSLTSTSGGVTDHVRITKCTSGVEGSGASNIDASAVIKTTGIANRLYGGGISYTINSYCTLSHETVVGGGVTLINNDGIAEIRGTAVESFTLTSSGAAETDFVCPTGTPITVNGTGGTLNIIGLHGGITDNSGAAVTINDLGADLTVIPNIYSDTNELQSNQGNWLTAVGFSTHTAADVWSVGTRLLTAGTNISLAKGVGITGLNDLSTSQVSSASDIALVSLGLDHLVSNVVSGTDITDNSIFAKIVSSAATADWDTYSNTTDSLQAIRDRGDSAWVTGGGGSIAEILNVYPLIPLSVDLADTATVRLGLMLFNSLDDLPTLAEITPGEISIERKSIGGTSWSPIVSGAACSELDGLIYYDEVFTSTNGYNEGDSLRITFNDQRITVSANDYEITGSAGRMFFTEIRQTMRGTDGANIVIPDPAGTAPTTIEIRQEIDTNSTEIAAILEDTGTTLDGKLDAIRSITDQFVFTVANQVDSNIISKSGFTLSSSGLDYIAETSDGAIELAKANWNTILTGATHNITNSAGRRIRNLQEFGTYQDDSTWIDTNNGSSGTTDYENGTILNKLDNIADSNTIADSLGLSGKAIVPGSNIILSVPQENQHFKGHNWTLALGGQSISATYIMGASVSGICSGGIPPEFEGCHINNVTIPPTHFERSDIQGTITLPVGVVEFHDCQGESGGLLDFGSSIADTLVNWTNFSGEIVIDNFGQLGTDILNIRGHGKIIFNANCIAGTVNWDGHFSIVNNGSGIIFNEDDISSNVSSLMSTVLSLSGNIENIVNEVWDEPTSEHILVGSTGRALQDAQSAGDPWSTELPGSYSGDQAGNRIVNMVSQESTSLALSGDIQNLSNELDGVGKIIVQPVQGNFSYTSIKNQKVEIKKGSSVEIAYSLSENISGYEVFFGAKDKPRSTEFTISEKNITGDVLDVEVGSGFISLSATETNIPDGDYIGEMKLTKDSIVLKPVEFKIRILPSILT